MNMGITRFIRENRREITDAIRATGYDGPLNDSDRRDWILNDEGLCNWARSERVTDGGGRI